MSFFFDRIGELKELSLPLNEFVFIQNLFVLARKKKELPVFEQVEITDIAAEGKAVAGVLRFANTSACAGAVNGNIFLMNTNSNINRNRYSII